MFLAATSASRADSGVLSGPAATLETGMTEANARRGQPISPGPEEERPRPRGRGRRSVPAAAVERIRELRDHGLATGDIATQLAAEGVRISSRTVARVLGDLGYDKLARRTRAQAGLARVESVGLPAAEAAVPDDFVGEELSSPFAGAFLLAAPLERIGFSTACERAKFPDHKGLPAPSALLTLIALKSLGPAREAWAREVMSDRALRAFAGVRGLPNPEELAAFSQAVTADSIARFQRELEGAARFRGLFPSGAVNLDYVPGTGTITSASPGGTSRGAGTSSPPGSLYLQDPDSCALISALTVSEGRDVDDVVGEDVLGRHDEAIARWSTLIFGAGLVTAGTLARVVAGRTTFIAERLRVGQLVRDISRFANWQGIDVPTAGIRYPETRILDSTVYVPGVPGPLRQVIVRGRESSVPPAFLLTNALECPPDVIVARYAHRWNPERGIGQAVQYLTLGTRTSPFRIAPALDATLTVLVDVLLRMMTQTPVGSATVPLGEAWSKIFRASGNVRFTRQRAEVTLPMRQQRFAPWASMGSLVPPKLPGMPVLPVTFRFD